MAALQNTLKRPRLDVVLDVKDFEDTWNVWETIRDQLEMRADVEAGIRELDAGKGIPHKKVFADLLKEVADARAKPPVHRGGTRSVASEIIAK